MTITTMRIARPGTPLDAETEWVDISPSIAAINLGFARTADAMYEMGQAAIRASQTITLAFPMSKRERRQMRTRFARLNRRPALIHKGGKPRV